MLISKQGHVNTRSLPLALSRDGQFYENGSTRCWTQSKGTKSDQNCIGINENDNMKYVCA